MSFYKLSVNRTVKTEVFPIKRQNISTIVISTTNIENCFLCIADENKFLIYSLDNGLGS